MTSPETYPVEPEPSDVDTASERSKRIRAGLNSLHTLQADIAAAYRHRDWEVLGYDSWDGYVEHEFVIARLRLPRDERRELVGNLREAGMSTRAIATATGTSKNTITEDLSQIGTPQFDPAPVTGLDGKTYTSPESAPDEPIEAELVEGEDAEQRKEEPVKRAPRRKPLTEQATAAGWEGRKWADKLARIVADDRRTKHADAVANAMCGHLHHIRDVVDEALTRLDDDAAT